MKTRIRLIAVWCVCLSAVAGASPDVGFVRLVHALGAGQGRLQFLIDGEVVFPDGYALGQRTGGIGLDARAHEIEVRRDGVEAGRTRIAIEAGETMTMVAFAEAVPPGRRAGGGPEWRARILRLRQRGAERGYRVSVISVAKDEEVDLQVVTGEQRAEGCMVKRLRVAMIELGKARREVELRHADGPLARLSLDDPGNYVVVIYDDAGGNLRALSYYDPRFVVAG